MIYIFAKDFQGKKFCVAFIGKFPVISLSYDQNQVMLKFSIPADIVKMYMDKYWK